MSNIYGFRPGRGCRDPLFVLHEIIANRGKKTVFMAFMDIRKAYDTVWSEALEYGGEGQNVECSEALEHRERESAVLIGDDVSDWFAVEVGLAQDCPLSPILFSLYINDLAIQVKEDGGAVSFGGVKYSILMYADDMVLLSEDSQGLQKSLDIAFEYSQKWRFQFNLGKDKTEIMIYRGVGCRKKERERIAGLSWLLDGKEVRIVDRYIYLGVLLTNNGKYVETRRMIEKRARKGFWTAVNMGVEGGWMNVDNAVMVWNCQVRSILEYGAEVLHFPNWKDPELLARKMGKCILGVRQSTVNEVVQGELGWWSMEGRRQLLRLKYWRFAFDRVADYVFHNRA